MSVIRKRLADMSFRMINIFGGCSNIARMHEKGSANLPARKHLTKIASSIYQFYLFSRIIK
ncbi:hypothetical protein [Borreliella garinii]|uniref:hypothetical protein n=1 Tax=Borreliella garinii TaxID=29519 RepID=UPI0004E233D1|nr:hypothetical protein [Borreliella garinii]